MNKPTMWIATLIASSALAGSNKGYTSTTNAKALPIASAKARPVSKRVAGFFRSFLGRKESAPTVDVAAVDQLFSRVSNLNRSGRANIVFRKLDHNYYDHFGDRIDITEAHVRQSTGAPVFVSAGDGERSKFVQVHSAQDLKRFLDDHPPLTQAEVSERAKQAKERAEREAKEARRLARQPRNSSVGTSTYEYAASQSASTYRTTWGSPEERVAKDPANRILFTTP